jgi:hypothetical protein
MDQKRILKAEIIRTLQELKNSEWNEANLNFDFPPYINKGWTGMQLFSDTQGHKIRLTLFGDEKFNNTLYKAIMELNKEENFNRITFIGSRKNLVEGSISISFEQEIVNKFEGNLPKSKRGKTLPWWKNPDEVKELI